MKKYAIWNKKDMILTPIGEVLTAAQWIERYPIAAVESITIICAAGEINGAFFGTLGQLVEMYTNDGCDFSDCVTPEEKLAAIEAFEAAKEEANARAAAEARAREEAAAQNAEIEATSLASIAAQLEYQNMMSLEDIEEV